MPTKSRKRRSGLAALLAAALILTSCQTTGTSGPDPELVACRSFEPVTWSAKDTPETIKQIKAHNAAWAAVCEERS